MKSSFSFYLTRGELVKNWNGQTSNSITFLYIPGYGAQKQNKHVPRLNKERLLINILSHDFIVRLREQNIESKLKRLLWNAKEIRKETQGKN